MNTNFTNSSFGRILYIAIITLIVAATIFVIWYMTAGYKLGTYDPDTRLGSVYIGGLTEEEVEPRLDKKITTWYNDPTIAFELEYQDYTYKFNRNLFFFNVESSVSIIKQGEINEILVYYQGADQESVETAIKELEFLDGVVDNINIDLLIDDILYDASLMKSYSIKNVEDYLVEPGLSIEDLDTSEFILPVGFEMDELIAKIVEKYPDGKIIIEKEELFDIITLFGDTMNDAEMSVLSSAMLELILDNTNFLVNEVHYDNILDFDNYPILEYAIVDHPYLGRNAYTAEIINESFSFYNPNSSDYYFEVDQINNELVLSGLPFEYEIIVEITMVELDSVFEEELDPIQQQVGYDGIMYEVSREILDIDGRVKSIEKTILSEFYPPKKEKGTSPSS